MKKNNVVSLLLVLCLVFALLPARAGAADYVEVSSADEMVRALADTPAQTLSFRSAATDPVRVLVLEPELPDTCGARRVLHYAAFDEYILEYDTRAAAEKGYDTLTGTFGLKRCWLDTPETSAHVFENDAVPMSADSWGMSYMHLTAYRNDAVTLAHFNAAQPCVAIIDTGVDPEAENLVARSYKSYDIVNGTTELSEVTSPAAGEARGHGTRVASILDAVLPENVRFMYLRVFNGDGANHTQVLSAIQYATEHGADVINLSLGWENGQHYDFLDEALEAAKQKGIVVVCAAGNKHQNVESSYPASNENTIAVSGINRRLAFDSYYSNYGEKIDFCAPGSDIKATALGGVTVNCAGTSFAAPHITAAAAELKMVEPTADAGRIYELLKACAKDLGETGKDDYYGWGIPVLSENDVRRIAHSWDAGHLTRDATVLRDGERVYTCTACGETRSETIPATAKTSDTDFVDVPDTEYYAIPVAWAAANGITNGTDPLHFSPDRVCTRAQVVTFLWRAAGSPDPVTATNRFTDVESGAYYYNAVRWAVENGITNGTSDTTFAPDDPCTRAHVVTFLWRLDKTGAGADTMGTETLPAASAAPLAVTFTDVPAGAYYAEAVNWAVRNGITNGMTPTTFGPDDGCTRAHVVTFLYRYVNGAE